MRSEVSDLSMDSNMIPKNMKEQSQQPMGFEQSFNHDNGYSQQPPLSYAPSNVNEENSLNAADEEMNEEEEEEDESMQGQVQEEES
jgi:hypothetical protein